MVPVGVGVDDGGVQQPVSETDPPSVVVVTGVPGSGKTTLGMALATALEGRFLSLDEIKERIHARSGGEKDRRELRLAAEAELCSALVSQTRPAVVDIWIAPDRDTARVAALLRRWEDRLLEVLCRVPADLAVARYVARPRGAPHLPPDEPMLQRIRAAVNALQPLGVGTCIEVDTSRPVDVTDVVARLRTTRLRLAGQGERPREIEPPRSTRDD